MTHRTAALFIVLVLVIGACSAAAAPTPNPTPEPTPAPTPTPQVIVKTIPVAPPTCLAAIDAADDVIANVTDWLAAMADNDYADATNHSDDTPHLMDTYNQTSAACRGAASNTSY